MNGEFRSEGFDNILAAYGALLDEWLFALGTIDGDEFTEADWTGYERWPVSTSVRELTDGSKALIAQVEFHGPEDVSSGPYNAIVLVKSPDEIQGVVEWSEPQNLPNGAVGRWQATFRV